MSRLRKAPMQYGGMSIWLWKHTQTQAHHAGLQKCATRWHTNTHRQTQTHTQAHTHGQNRIRWWDNSIDSCIYYAVSLTNIPDWVGSPVPSNPLISTWHTLLPYASRDPFARTDSLWLWPRHTSNPLFASWIYNKASPLQTARTNNLWILTLP